MYMWLLSRICIALIYVHGCIWEEKTRRGGGSGPGKGRGEGRGGEGSRVASPSRSRSQIFCGRQAGLEPDQTGELPDHAPPLDRLVGGKTRRINTERGQSCDCAEKCMVYTYWRSRKRGGRRGAVGIQKFCNKSQSLLHANYWHTVAAVHWLIIEDDKMLLRTVLLAIVALVSSQGSQVRASN